MANGAQLLGDKELAKLLKTAWRACAAEGSASGGQRWLHSPSSKLLDRSALKQSGLLRKSLNKKLKTYPEKMTVVGIIGPRTSVVGEFEGKKRWPVKYAHLQEKGFIDESGKFIPPQPFLGPAMESTEGQALGIMRDKLAAGVLKEASQND